MARCCRLQRQFDLENPNDSSVAWKKVGSLPLACSLAGSFRRRCLSPPPAPFCLPTCHPTDFAALGRGGLPQGFVVTSFVLGSAVGSLSFSLLADRYGRRATLFLGAAVFSAGGAAQASAAQIESTHPSYTLEGIAAITKDFGQSGCTGEPQWHGSSPTRKRESERERARRLCPDPPT